MMSLFYQTNAQLKKTLDTLPAGFTDTEITCMVDDLTEDLARHSDRQFSNLADKVMFFSDRHKKLCLSFSFLFRSIVKGTFTPAMLKTFLATRRRMRTGEISDEEAKNLLVDAGVKHINERKNDLSTS